MKRLKTFFKPLAFLAALVVSLMAIQPVQGFSILPWPLPPPLPTPIPIPPIQPNCVTPPAGIVAWWPAEGNANDVISGNNGTLEGGAAFAPGKVGQGFRFDGTNGFVQIPDSAALKPTNVTVEAWVWLDPNLPANNGGEQIVFKKNTWSAWFEGYSLLKATIDNGNGTYSDRFQFCVSRYGNQVAINSQTIVQRGVWYHVAATYDGNRSILYVNGVAEASATPGFALDYDTTPVFIGTSGTWPPYLSMFGGIIDEASIYNRALSSNEIAAVFNAGSTGKCPPVCVTPPADMVGWWKGDSNTVDSFAGNDGVNQNITYTNGVDGQAFACDPENYPYFTYTGIQVADQPAYALTNSLTIEGWVRPRGDSYIIFWRGDHRPGLDPYYISMQDNHTLRFGICDADGNSAYVETTLDYFIWTHVAATLDGSTGALSIYTNGVLAVQTNTNIRPFGALEADQSPGVGIGNLNDGGNQFPFIGDIDEIALYSRALTPTEIQSIYAAGSAGKCVGPIPPEITTQPMSQTDVAGSNLVLSVTVGGTGPFSYQWSFNGTNIAGATNDTLSLDNLHTYQSGDYAVTVTSAYGSATGTIADIVVTAQNILAYTYSGTEKITMSGQSYSYAYSGQMFFIPAITNGAFVGWSTIKGKKQYWVSDLSDYLMITVPGSSSQTFTVLGQAGQGFDTNGYPHLWAYLHKGQNTQLTIGKKMHFTFPGIFAGNDTHVYPDPQNGGMVLTESASTFIFAPQITQKANNNGQTLADLVNALTQKLAHQGYQKQ